MTYFRDANDFYISDTLRSVCCNTPLVMVSDFINDRNKVHCVRCAVIVGLPDGDDYHDLYRDRIPRWVKGELIRAAMANLTESFEQAAQAFSRMLQTRGTIGNADHMLATARKLEDHDHLMEQARYFAQHPWMSYEDGEEHNRGD